jgi:hypothetical protein
MNMGYYPETVFRHIEIDFYYKVNEHG